MSNILQMVREQVNRIRYRLSDDERALALHVRTNEPLYAALQKFLLAPISGRAAMPPPASPVECAMSMARDHELRRLLARLDTLKRAPVAEVDEHPDAGPSER